MKKIDAIQIINNESSSNNLNTKNTHWANLSTYKENQGWWLNIPFGRFSETLHLLINEKDLGILLHLKISANLIKNPKKVFRNKDETADIFIKSPSPYNLNSNYDYIDIQSNGTEFNFSSYIVKLYEFPSNKNDHDVLYPEEIETNLVEGLTKTITVNYYERNTKARDACIKLHGYNCIVCGFNFENSYGARGKDFIHVHHLKAISDIGEKYIIDPESDLKPVCPNCHAMLHRKGNISIDELTNEIKSLKANKN